MPRTTRAGAPCARSRAATLHRAIAAANTSGDLRITATARMHLARILRAAGSADEALVLLRLNEHWYATAGGDGALLTRCLLADSVAELQAVLGQARAAEDREAELYALDALAARAADGPAAAALLAESDALAASIPHLVDEGDRLDAHSARRRR